MDKSAFKSICSSIDKLDKLEWADVKKELIDKGCSEDQANIIGKFTALRGDPYNVLNELIEKKYFEKAAWVAKEL